MSAKPGDCRDCGTCDECVERSRAHFDEMHDREHLRPVGMATVLKAFAKLFAPKPHVYVFHSLTGWQYATAEMPDTHQALIGMSEGLYRAVRNHLIAQTMTHLEDRATVEYVRNESSVRIHVQPRAVVALTPDGPPDFSHPQEIELRPKPMRGV